MLIEKFLLEIDHRWKSPGQERLKLQIIGSAALMLQADYHRGTKDSDVLETNELIGATKDQLLKLAGEGTAFHRRHRMYLDIVHRGLPFLPQQPLWHPHEDLNVLLEHFEVETLDVVDVVVSKLKRFSRDDQSDIDAMVQKDLVPHHHLISRFHDAVDWFSMDSRAPDLPRYVENLHRVERDMLGEDESELELPSWI